MFNKRIDLEGGALYVQRTRGTDPFDIFVGLNSAADEGRRTHHTNFGLTKAQAREIADALLAAIKEEG